MAPRMEMTDDHKAALAEGRSQGRAVRSYLEALEAHKPKRGRKRTPESMRARLATIEATIDNADPMSRLQLVQDKVAFGEVQRERKKYEHDAKSNVLDFLAITIGKQGTKQHHKQHELSPLLE